MSGFDEGRISYASFNLNTAQDTANQPTNYTAKFIDFIRSFRRENVHIYQEQLRNNFMLQRYELVVQTEDLLIYDEKLMTELRLRPTELLVQFETAALNQVKNLLAGQDHSLIKSVQVQLVGTIDIQSVRTLGSSHVSQLVRIEGIVISATRTRSKATTLAIQCSKCRTVKYLSVRDGFGGVNLPRTCDGTGGPQVGEEKCPLDPYVMLPSKTIYVDQQTLKLQELPENVPTGEMPRSVLLAAERYLVNKVVPGTRMQCIGIYSIFQSSETGSKNAGPAIRTPYLRLVGIETDTDGQRNQSTPFTKEEENEFLEMARRPNICNEISRSIAPALYGHTEVKLALACLLFGGCRKALTDGMRLRGDINVLLLGDPSTGKSQLLKFVEKVAPIAVYTSGKGSSAAGLTAAVVRDPSSGEFFLEGGAMVLADGGVVCIDEFDKMRDEDRVAIHEAMEQQTISIAKAGITTILNSRASVLAAANPHFGRYDDLKTATENIDFQSTILSRFDLIFLVRDNRDGDRDRILAQHVLDIHKDRQQQSTTDSDQQLRALKRYIAFCRSRCTPRITRDVATTLQNHYVNARATAKEQKVTSDLSTIPITVRQLESLIRISESLAKMSLSPHVADQNVEQAWQLFRVATMNAIKAGVGYTEMGVPPEQKDEVPRCETSIKRRLPVTTRIPTTKLYRDLEAMGYNSNVINTAIVCMLKRDELQLQNQRKFVVRVK
eukprot:gnl/Spiro4/26476_TR13173_c0_g1_i1.p1 gnl/Spiro4/26476_TR13173_c0_g1~~gnl/Spiro4/26476_TR13173_c0_g1_i1.p1  ORF type:complete len:722 (+),score=223.53 gnl/Spiro4/26476_TR13173_c0_g1_i1:64-2229(+)